MPRGKIADKFFERLREVEVRVEALMTWQKWQMGILAAILITVVTKAVWR